MSLLTPNKIEWAKCPHCKFTLNSWEGVSVEALANPYYVHTVCPNQKCGKRIGVKVRVVFEVDAISLEKPEIIECTPGCGGCSCFSHPPCAHCSEGHGQEREV